MMSRGIRRRSVLIVVIPAGLLFLSARPANATSVRCEGSAPRPAMVLGAQLCAGALEASDVEEATWIGPLALPPPGYRDAFAPPVVADEVWDRIGATSSASRRTVVYQTVFIPIAWTNQEFAMDDLLIKFAHHGEGDDFKIKFAHHAKDDRFLKGRFKHHEHDNGVSEAAAEDESTLESAAVPEPASLLLVGAGLIVAGLRIRRLPHE